MVEMVFVLPVLLLLVFSIAEFGLMFSRWLTLSNAVREGARLAVVYRSPCDEPAVSQSIRDRVKNYASAGGITLDNGDITLVGVCAGSDTQATVSAAFAFPFQVLPGLASLAPDINLSYQAAMRNE